MKYTVSLVYLLMVITIVSCKDRTEKPISESNNTMDVMVDTSAISKPMCYLYAVNNDSISLNVLKTGDKIQGQMAYSFYQIDGSSGTFNGIMKGDTLIGVYNFEAEGTKSRRELVFLKTANGLAPGEGETEVVANTEMFKKKTPFTFNKDRVLKEIDCRQ